jgi:eukaryotic-like serine/threonine-protein kinase
MHTKADAFAQRWGLNPAATVALAGLLDEATKRPPRVPAQSTMVGFETIDLLGKDHPAEERPFEEQPFDETPFEEEQTRELTRSPIRVAALDRYTDLGLLGVGGMGEVRRVLDRDLNRTMAMKVIRPELSEHPDVLARFIEEAQCSAQLQHPGIVPVHELGRLPTGENYFTMAEVRGRTFSEVIQEVHRSADAAGWREGATGWTFRRLVDALRRACESVAYAHSRGVIHRDLKPDNIMLGAHGEVLVVDWGLAKVAANVSHATNARDAAPTASSLDAANHVVTARSSDSAQATRMGAVAGTPTYMPPEQARGHIDRIDARSDVYALGAVLYVVLAGRPPYQGDATAVLDQVLAGPPTAPGRVARGASSVLFGHGGTALDRSDAANPAAPSNPAPLAMPVSPHLPAELVAVCNQAMAREPADRFRDAGELASQLADWLDGAHRKEQALQVVRRAIALRPDIAALRAGAAALQVEAAALLEGVSPWQAESDKRPGWAKQDQAERMLAEGDSLDLKVEQGLHGALRIDADLVEAHAALAERHLATHLEAELARDNRGAHRAEAALRAHVRALPEGDETRTRCATYLHGDGTLTLHTNPPGAEVLLHRFVTNNRRLEPVFERSLGKTPLHSVPLARGSYLCILRTAGRPDVRYPVHIGRQEHWHGVPPGATEPHPIWLPSAGDLGPLDHPVPAGWFGSGGDPEAPNSRPRRRLWCDGAVFRRFPVTNTEYIGFLDALVEVGREADALAHAPRERAGTVGEQGALIYGFQDGRFHLRPDAEGDVWRPDWPVMMVDWSGASAFAAWEAQRTGEAWRLPYELEWEKAARGVDGRFYPWGDWLDPAWCCMRQSHDGRPVPKSVHSHPVDEGPSGVRGMAGNVRDWCADRDPERTPPPDEQRVLVSDAEDSSYRCYRGGGWINVGANLRTTVRFKNVASFRFANLGFRLARSSP